MIYFGAIVVLTFRRRLLDESGLGFFGNVAKPLPTARFGCFFSTGVFFVVLDRKATPIILCYGPPIPPQLASRDPPYRNSTLRIGDSRDPLVCYLGLGLTFPPFFKPPHERPSPDGRVF